MSREEEKEATYVQRKSNLLGDDAADDNENFTIYTATAADDYLFVSISLKIPGNLALAGTLTAHPNGTLQPPIFAALWFLLIIDLVNACCTMTRETT